MNYANADEKRHRKLSLNMLFLDGHVAPVTKPNISTFTGSPDTFLNENYYQRPWFPF